MAARYRVSGFLRSHHRFLFHLTLLSLITVLLVPTAAYADIRPDPVKARLVGPVRFAAAGTEFTATVEISAARDLSVTGLSVAGDGWQVIRTGSAADVSLSAGGSVPWTFTAVPGSGFGPLVLSGLVDGRPWRRSLDLSRETFGGRMPADSPDPPPGRVLSATSSAFPDALELPLAALSAAVIAGGAAGEADDGADRGVVPPDGDKDGRQAVTITGKIVYWHDAAGTDVPANGVKVIVHYAPFWAGTNPVQAGTDGVFSIPIPWAGRFYVRFEAANAAALVEDSSWEADYVWTSGMMEAPEGVSQFDIGWLAPTSHIAALQILSDITYSHEYFGSMGYDVDKIDVQWPDNSEDTSYYDPYWEEIHLQTADGRSDPTICHEWGHYWNAIHAHAPEPDYCNGICDDGGCGHCEWCPELHVTAWLEGFAQLMSRLCTDRIDEAVTYPVGHVPIHDIPNGLYGSTSPSCPWDPWNIENVWAAAAYDMVDIDSGTEHDLPIADALGDSLMDMMHIPVPDLVSILAEPCDAEGHEPYRAEGFFHCALEYCESYGSPAIMRSRLWETARNCDLDIDDATPGAVSNLTCSLPVGVPTQISLAHFEWDTPSDDVSGACAYSFEMHSGHSVSPDHVIDGTAPWWNSGQLAVGSWYFSVIAVDRSGRWCTTPTIIGPIIIQAPGAAELLPETPADWTAPLVLRSTTVAATGAVTQSAAIQGQTVYINYAGRNSGTGPTGNFLDHGVVDGVTTYLSTTHYYGAQYSFQQRNQGPQNLGLTGRHAVWIRLDGGDTVPEANEANNIYAKQFVFNPTDLDLGEMVTDTDGVPDPTAGQSLLPGGTPFYPNCDGYHLELGIYPELVWAVSQDESDRHTLRLHPNSVYQDGFAASLLESTTSPDLPAVLIQNPGETGLVSYCVGVSGAETAEGSYRICREQGQLFAIPDTITRNAQASDCLDLYIAYNDLGEDGWFTIKLTNGSTAPMQLRFYDPGFAQGSLDDADAVLTAAPHDTLAHNVFLPHGAMALVVVSRDPRTTQTAMYEIAAYHRKPDLEASKPTNWYANVVPQVGRPYATGGAVPAPSLLRGGVDSTGIYYAFHNDSPAGVPIGLRDDVYVDGAAIFASTFIEPLLPEQELRLVSSSLYTVRGGRHTLTHRLNSNLHIDEDDYTNNFHGRQWVWSPLEIAASEASIQPAPPSAHGGWSQVTEGVRVENCDGFHASSYNSHVTTIFAAYVADDVLDVNVGLYAGSGVIDGFTDSYALSQTSGAGCDFVLRAVPATVHASHTIGVTRASGSSSGDYALATMLSLESWVDPVGERLTGTTEPNTYMDVTSLQLPPGRYEFTLRSADVELGFSLHDVSSSLLASGFGEKSSPFGNGLAVQPPGTAGQDVLFTVDVPNPAPTRLALVVWRPDGSTVATSADWRVYVSEDLAAAVPSGPAIIVSRLAGVAPNPFNPHTTITFETAQAGRISLAIHDMSGRLVRTLVESDLPPGRRSATWNGLDESGRPVPSGIYVARLRVGGREAGRLKMTLLK